jgi:hypothetical protein
LLATLPMHPICAWGVITDLASYYNTGRRGSAAYEPKGALEIFKVAAGSMGQTWRTLSSIVGSRVAKEKKALATSVAESVDWAKLLSTDCTNARSREQVMAPACVGKVCWNMVQDFRDLWCSWWKTDALGKGCSVLNGECCSAIGSEHMAWIAAEFDAKDDPHALAKLRVERLKALISAYQRQALTEDMRVLLKRELEVLHDVIKERVNSYYAMLRADDVGLHTRGYSLDMEERSEETLEHERGKMMEKLMVSQEEMHIAEANVTNLTIALQFS